MDRTLYNLKRRLEKAELDHLREHARDLAERLEMAEERARHAEDMADFYGDQYSNLIRSITEQEDVMVCLAKDGSTSIKTTDTVHVGEFGLTDSQYSIAADVFQAAIRTEKPMTATVTGRVIKLQVVEPA